jgi:hypothetical protein
MKMPEQAFKGTVKEGFERRFTIINEHDFQKYVPEPAQEDFRITLNNMSAWIEDGRMQEGKQPYNSYVVINLDEPYIKEIIEIMKRNGHWEGELTQNNIDIAEWIKKSIEGTGGLLDYERYELAVRNDTDEIVSASWIIRCLANPDNEGSDKVLRAILDYRASTKKGGGN